MFKKTFVFFSTIVIGSTCFLPKTIAKKATQPFNMSIFTKIVLHQLYLITFVAVLFGYIFMYFIYILATKLISECDVPA